MEAFPLDPKDEFILCHKSELEATDPRDYGDIKIVQALWDLIRMDQIIEKAHPDCERKRHCKNMLLALVANRCIEPMSKLEFVDWVKHTELVERLNDTEDLHENAVYRCMDHIVSVRTKIEQEIQASLKTLFNTSTDTLFYDLTSTFFTGDGPTIAEPGYSRDHRPDCKQVNWGLVMTKDGFPLTFEVYPGNRVDKTTVEHIRTKLKDKFGVKQCVFVGDRGMLTQDNLKVLKQDDNKFIIADRNDWIKVEVLTHLSDHPVDTFEKIKDNLWISEYETTEIWEGEGDEPDEEVQLRYVVCYNPENAKDETDVDKWLDKGRKELRAVERMVARGSIKDHDKVIERIVKKLVKVRMDRFFDWEVPPSPVEGFKWWVREEALKGLDKMGGIWVVKTNIPKEEMSAKEVALQYKQLQLIERAFKIIKAVNLVRPVNHRKNERVECHLFICVIAYLLERVLERVQEIRGEAPVMGPRLIRKFRNVKSFELTAGEYKTRLVTPFDDEQRALLEYIENGARGD